VPLKFPPGEGWFYGPAVDWAGMCLESVTRSKLSAYLEENVLRPLSMEDTTFYRNALHDRVAARTAVPTLRDSDDSRLSTVPWLTPANPPIESGGAGLYTTASDFAKLLQALLNGVADAEGKGILKKETVSNMFCPQLTEQQRQMVGSNIQGMAPQYVDGSLLDFSFGGLVNLEDREGRRKAGSLSWLGMANSHWVSTIS